MNWLPCSLAPFFAAQEWLAVLEPEWAGLKKMWPDLQTRQQFCSRLVAHTLQGGVFFGQVWEVNNGTQPKRGYEGKRRRSDDDESSGSIVMRRSTSRNVKQRTGETDEELSSLMKTNMKMVPGRKTGVGGAGCKRHASDDLKSSYSTESAHGGNQHLYMHMDRSTQIQTARLTTRRVKSRITPVDHNTLECSLSVFPESSSSHSPTHHSPNYSFSSTSSTPAYSSLSSISSQGHPSSSYPSSLNTNAVSSQFFPVPTTPQHLQQPSSHGCGPEQSSNIDNDLFRFQTAFKAEQEQSLDFEAMDCDGDG